MATATGTATRRLAMSSGTDHTPAPGYAGLEERLRVGCCRWVETDEGGRGVDAELYLHGLAAADFELALRGLLGEGARCRGSSQAPGPLVECSRCGRSGPWRTVRLSVWADGIS